MRIFNMNIKFENLINNLDFNLIIKLYKQKFIIKLEIIFYLKLIVKDSNLLNFYKLVKNDGL